jgi:hypothetical protein
VVLVYWDDDDGQAHSAGFDVVTGQVVWESGEIKSREDGDNGEER